MAKRSFEEMDEYNEIIFYLLAWLAFWLIIEIKILFTCGTRTWRTEISRLMTDRAMLKKPEPTIKDDCDFIIGNLYPSSRLNEF